MSQRDIPLTARAGQSRRDPRIDLFRGLALVMIFIDHIPGNPYEHYTLKNWGFSDAAEAFFVMSGIAAGLAYGGAFLPERVTQTGYWAAIRPLWVRARKLYLVHLMLTFTAIALFAVGAAVFAMPEMRTLHNLGAVFEKPLTVVPGIFGLGHQIGYVNILSTYAVILLGLPAMILLAHRSPWGAVAASAAIWFCAGLWRINMPNVPNGGGWFFNPLSWQFMFVIGLTIGIRMKQGKRLVPRSPILMVAAVSLLGFVVAWKYIPDLGVAMNRLMWSLGKMGAPFHIVSHDKTYLAVPRLIHALSLLYVLSCLPVVTRTAASSLASPLRLMGRQGLAVFAGGTVMALSAQVLLRGFGIDTWLAWALPPMGIAAMIVLAWISENGLSLGTAPGNTKFARVTAPKRGA